MAKAKNKVVDSTDSIEERVRSFEAAVKEAMQTNQIGMSLNLTGPWEGHPKIEAVLRYVDLNEAKQNVETESEKTE